jgi:hypothetical protein
MQALTQRTFDQPSLPGMQALTQRTFDQPSLPGMHHPQVSADHYPTEKDEALASYRRVYQDQPLAIQAIQQCRHPTVPLLPTSQYRQD